MDLGDLSGRELGRVGHLVHRAVLHHHLVVDVGGGADQVEIEGKTYLQLTTTNQDVVIVDEQHPIFMREFAGELRPYVHVRFGMNALIQRQSFYHLVNYGNLSENQQGDTVLTLKSGDLVLHLST